jgi:uncharacterized protein YndB with AHSA1/START domain
MAFPLSVTQTVSTSASPAAVWRAFERVDLWPTAIPALAAAKLKPRGALAAGSRILTRATPSSGSADIEYKVVAAEPPRRLVLTIDDPDYRSRFEYRIAAEAGATDVVVTATLEAVGLMQTVRFLLWQTRLMPILGTTARERTQALVHLAERLGGGA